MVFQNYALFPHLSVADNITFGLSVRKVEAAESARRLQSTAELLGLRALLERKPSQLSGGQQQRVALGRALVAQTRVCLMDEPLSNLDAQLRQEMRRELRELQQRLGLTVVYVTHDQTEAMSMADQVVLLNQGHVEQDASPRALYAMPATTFAARFIGTPAMNLLRLEQRPHRRQQRLGRSAGQHAGRAARVGVALGGAVPATVQSLEYLGADLVLRCAVGSEQITVRADRQDRCRRGGRRSRSAGRCRPNTISIHRAAASPDARSTTDGDQTMQRRTFNHLLAAAALAGVALGAAAQAPTEISFFYPVAVGGPITKLIDDYAADFGKENPGIKVTPIYAGSYQDTIVKALTAHKSGTPAGDFGAAVDRHVHADRRGRDRADRQLRQDRRRQGLAGRLLQGLHAEQPERRQDLGRAVPALDHRACTTTRNCSRPPGWTRASRPPPGPRWPTRRTS